MTISEDPEKGEPGAPAAGEPAADGVGDALRTAVERTLAVTADSATGTRQRAQGLLDDVVRRSQVAREEVARRGEEATTRLAEAISELRSADDAGIRDLSDRLAVVERRLAALETSSAPVVPRSNPEVQAETKPLEAHQQRDSGE